ncbi:hypothetical protein B0H63DRAFT_552774 [Podospora didyma]|uniref:F-box domain-containing protein n=1 Tax=Podospora didyma TaxID=330526 RepID=A0AAE0N5X9_9PEZI|nr:hypothetical protein B0H63DRAFT_552774 [Podospora didyma]
MTATSAFFGVPELVSCLMEQIQSRKQLAKSRLVSKSLNASATPFLYRELYYELDGDKYASLSDDGAPLGLVRKLVVEGGARVEWPACNDILQKMLPKMPQLEGVDFVDIPLTITTIDVLRSSCRQLKSLSIRYPPHMDELVLALDEYSPEPRDDPNPLQIEARKLCSKPSGVALFAGLEELTLEYLYDDLAWWRTTIAQMLRNSPGLKKLELSIAGFTIGRYYSNHNEELVEFFTDVCEEYAVATGTNAPPPPLLQLESLHCGQCIYPTSDWNKQLRSLEKLTDLRRLQQLHVFDEEVTAISRVVMDPSTPPLLDIFGPDHCPNLRRFTIGEYSKDVEEVLAGIADASFARQLAISCKRQGQGREMATLLRPNPAYPFLPRHFRMLDIDLQRDFVYLDYHEDEEIPAETILEELVADDDGALEGLAIRLPWITLEDEEGEENNERKGEDENGEKEHKEGEGENERVEKNEEKEKKKEDECTFEHLGLLEQALPRLVNLTQLVVPMDDFGRRPEFSENMVTSAAKRLAAAGPTLRYINVYWRHWRIWRDGRDDNGAAVRLEELDKDEIRHVELFAHTIFQPEAP